MGRMKNREDEMNAAWVVEKRGDNEVPCEKNGEWGRMKQRRTARCGRRVTGDVQFVR